MSTNCRTEFIDISVPLSDELPVWPGGYGFHKHPLLSIAGGCDANVSRLDFDVHSGTHIDAPLHFIQRGKPTTEISLDKFIGEATVLQFDSMEVITVADLDTKTIPNNCRRVLLKTENSQKQWYKKIFDPNFVAISNEAAKWLVQRGIFLVGIDGPSIQKFSDSKDTHVSLLRNDVVILEGLNLENVNEGLYELICLPINAAGCEGVPARAILKKL